MIDPVLDAAFRETFTSAPGRQVLVWLMTATGVESSPSRNEFDHGRAYIGHLIKERVLLSCPDVWLGILKDAATAKREQLLTKEENHE